MPASSTTVDRGRSFGDPTYAFTRTLTSVRPWPAFCILCMAWFFSGTFASAQTDRPSAAQDRPNILWFIVDDMSADFSCYGQTLITTPHVDRLAREGVQFRHAFVTAPVCSPCRSALITGMYQTSIGAHHHRSGRGELKIELPEGVKPIPELLQAAGYYTCIGNGLVNSNGNARNANAKNANANQNARPKAANAKAALGKTDYNFQWSQSIYDANDWAGRKPGQPFFMQVQLAGGKLRGDSDQSTAKLSEQAEQVFGKATDPEQVTLAPYYPRDPVLLRDQAAYLDSVRLTDRHVGQVLKRLEDEGVLEDTLVIFMTDHGISHARGKQFLYNEGTHVPLVVRAPQNFPKLTARMPRGKVRDDLVEHIDLAAISLAAAGIERPAKMQAQDPFADGYISRKAVYAARDRCDETIERLRSVRTDQYLYIRNFYPEQPALQPNAYKDGKAILKALRRLHASGELSELSERLLFAEHRPAEELYDWRADPWQINNLAAQPEHRGTLESMRAQLDHWMDDTHDHGAESEAMYDSDMATYLGKGNPEVEKNIAIMKRWAYK